MRQIVQTTSVLLMVLFAFATFTPSRAEPSAIPCSPYVQPGLCEPSYQRGDQLRIGSGVPFVWLRATPSSYGQIRSTVWSSSGAVLQVVSYPPSWDGYQSWYFVARTGNLLVNGWVEQASLVNAVRVITPIPVTSLKANWPVPIIASLKPGLPFGWFRSYPTSYAPNVYTIYPKTLFTVLANPAASFDGVQWWWPVRLLIPGIAVSGWLEQASIVSNPTIPTPTTPTIVTAAAFQSFQSGYMVWIGSDDQIYVFYGTNGGFYNSFPLNSYGSLPENPFTDLAPSGLVKPIRGFGRVWGNFTFVRQNLGWGLQLEQGYTATFTTLVAYPYNQSQLRLTLPDGHTINTLGSTWSIR